MPTYTGSCLCGGIQFRIDGELAPIQVCHCEQCRKAQGGPFATNIPVPRAMFSLVAGQELLRRFESSPGKVRAFCSVCGSPVLSERTGAPDVVRVRAGLLNEALPVRPAFHMFVAGKSNWWPIQDSLPQHAGRHVPPPLPNQP